MYANLDATILEPLNSDDGICDAARVSFAKIAANYPPEKNLGVMRYMRDHAHWSPFGHAREIFMMQIDLPDWCYFLTYANTAGFTWHKANDQIVFLCGSAWAWHESLSFLPRHIADGVRRWYRETDRYTLSAPLLFREPQGFDRGHMILGVPGSVINVIPRDVREYADITSASFRIKAPIYVARQYVKHQVDLCWNEVSRRYVTDEPEFYRNGGWRPKPEGSAKQGSGGGLLTLDDDLAARLHDHAAPRADLYRDMIAADIAPEQAREVLPLNMMTEWIWTGSIAAFRRVCNLRLDGHAQKEAQLIAQMIDAQLEVRVPVIWNSLRNNPPHIEYG